MKTVVNIDSIQLCRINTSGTVVNDSNIKSYHGQERNLISFIVSITTQTDEKRDRCKFGSHHKVYHFKHSHQTVHTSNINRFNN